MVNRSELEPIIREIIAEQLPVPTPQPSMWDKLKTKLSEPSTQQGLIVLIPLIISYIIEVDRQTMTDITISVLTIVAGHNIIRKENV